MVMISSQLKAEPVEVALTFDDLPWVWENPPEGHANRDLVQDIIRVLAKHQIKGVFAFVNAAKASNPGDKEILDVWVKSGHMLGNHTWNHADLNLVSVRDYTAEIDKNDKFLSLYGDQFIKFFRYPFLHEGQTSEKRLEIRNHLFNSGYRIAQVTVDGGDWQWYGPYARCLAQSNQEKIRWLRESYDSEARENFKAARLMSDFLFKRQIKHIALFHPNAMTAGQLDNVISQWKADGAEFITLQNAVMDPVYDIDPNVVRDEPYLFTNQIRIMRGLANPPEVQSIFRKSAEIEVQLESACR